MVTTFSIIDAELARWHPERLEDPVVTQAVPVAKRRTALSARAWVEKDELDALAVNLHAARMLHAADVPLVIGSDAGSSSLLSQFHAASTLRELELRAEARVANVDVLSAATRRQPQDSVEPSR